MKKGILVLMVAVAFGVGVCGCSKRSDTPSEQPSETRDPNDPGPRLEDFPEPTDDGVSEEPSGGENPIPDPQNDDVTVESVNDAPNSDSWDGGDVSDESAESDEPAETTDFDALREEVERLIDQ